MYTALYLQANAGQWRLNIYPKWFAVVLRSPQVDVTELKKWSASPKYREPVKIITNKQNSPTFCTGRCSPSGGRSRPEYAIGDTLHCAHNQLWVMMMSSLSWLWKFILLNYSLFDNQTGLKTNAWNILHCPKLNTWLHVPVIHQTSIACFRYRCIVPYPPQSELELELKLDDIVYVYKKRDDHWYKGTLQRTGKTGLFPASFVEKI